MRDSEKGGKKPIEAVEKLRPHKAKLERVIRSITKKEKPQEFLQRQEDFYKAVMENTFFGFTLIDCNYNIVLVNSLMCNYFHKPAGELIGKKCFREFEKRPSICPHCPGKRAMVTSRPAEVEIEKVRDDGSHFSACIQAFPTLDSDGAVTGFIEIVEDITERKKTGQELIQRHNLLRLLIDNLPDRVYVKDCKSRFILGNDAVVKYEGVQFEKELLGKTDFELYPKELAATFYAKEQQVIQKGRPMINEEEFWMDKQGNEQWLLTTKIPLRDENGKIVGLVGINHDITERKKAEEALKRSEEKFRNIFENSNVGISVTSLDGTFNANTVFCDMLGYSKEELSRVKWMDITLQEDIALSNNYLGQLRSGKKKSVRFQKRYVKKDGSIIFADTSVTLQKDKDGKPPYYITTIMDITERKKVEQALRESEEKWRSLVKNAPNLIIIVNSDSTIQFINRTVPPLTIEEVIGKSIYDYIEPEYQDVMRKTIDYVFQTGEHGRCEIRGVGPNGRSSWYETQAGPVKRDEQIVAVTLITTDVTERKNAQEQIERLARLPEENSSPVYRVSKDGILLYANPASRRLILEDQTKIGDKVPEKLIRMIKNVYDSGTRQRVEVELNKRIFLFEQVPVIEGGYVNSYAIDITERKKADKKIYDYQQQLKALSYQLSLIEERAKRKIVAELHDNVGQKLAVAKLELQSLMRSSPDTKMSDSINGVCGEITRIINDVHSLTFEIGNPLLDKIGLTAALERYITEEIQAKCEIKCELNDKAGSQDMEETVRTVLYRSTRELLINAVKHARAHNIKVRIYRSAGLPPRLPPRLLVEDKSGGAAGNIHICVEDNGVGFEVSKIASLPTRTGGFGLFSIKEQLEYIGGNLQVESSVGHGTMVTISCPPKLKPAFA